MAAGGVGDYIDPERVTREFVRVRRGYDPPAVDAHLAVVRDAVEQLLRKVHSEQDESLDIVLRATRRSVDEALEGAREKAAGILAEAETAAGARIEGATAEAAGIVAEAQARSRQRDEASHERYVELGRLLELRQTELEGLDEQIAQRQQVLRQTAHDLRSLADGMPANGEHPSPAGDGFELPPNGVDDLRVPEGVELHFPEQVPSDA